MTEYGDGQLKDREYREWLESGPWSENSVNSRVSVVRRLERLGNALDENFQTLENAYEGDQFASLLSVLSDYKSDAKTGGHKYRALMPDSKTPSGGLSNAISFLRQYGRFLDGAPPPNASEDWPELIELKKRFLLKCGDFKNFTQTSGTYWNLEREYKDEMINDIHDLFEKGLSDSEIAFEICEILLKGQNGKGAPLRWATFDAIKKEFSKFQSEFYDILGSYSTISNPKAQDVADLGAELWSLKERGLSRLTKGEVISISFSFLACLNPEELCFTKITKAKELGNTLSGDQIFSSSTFLKSEVLDFFDLNYRVFDVIEAEWDWKPKDLFDVQSFIWAALDDRWGADKELVVSGLTRMAVLQAMAECDEVGEKEFLTSYGFGKTMRYRVRYDGSNYPLKAISKVAYKFTDYGKVKNMTGGAKSAGSAGAKLKALGFEVYETNQNKERAMTKSHPLNQILYGPPGTGKTWTTSEIAVEICDGHASTDRVELMGRYRELVEAKRIAFTTFHQSMGYEEFVEGLRPTTESDANEGEASGGFRLVSRNGIFRQICTRAKGAGIKSGSLTPIDLTGRQFFKMSLGRANSQNHIYEAALDKNKIAIGYGGEFDWSDPKYDSYEAIKAKWQEFDPEATGNNPNIAQVYNFRGNMKKGDIVIVSDGNFKFRAIAEIIGDYEYAQDGVFNDDMIGEGQLYPHQRAVKWHKVLEESLPYDEIKDGQFSQVSCYNISPEKIKSEALQSHINLADKGDASSNSAEAKNFVLIIDEINRANISKVFGELITLLEPDKRLGAGENALKVTLPYSKDEFGVPKNLYLVGTMNTADRSIALLDTALRRRFSFKEMMPDYSVINKSVEGVKLGVFLEAINARIEWMFDRDHQIGHSFLTSVTTLGGLEQVVREKIIPLLTEYFYEDWGKVCVALNDKANRFILKEPLVAPALQDSAQEERFRYVVNPDPFSLEAYKAVYQT